MDRKEAIRYISLLLGGTLVGAQAFISGCRNEGAEPFSEDEIRFLGEIADTILPETGTPGAKAAGVGPFMAMMVVDCYDQAERDIFRNGIREIDRNASKEYGKSFPDLSPSQRHDLLLKADRAQREYMASKKENEPVHYFRMMKELTLLGYFSSKPGCTQARRYMPVPGKYIGCVEYRKGDKIIV